MPSQFSFPEIIDSTARREFASCPYKFYVRRVMKLKPKGTNPHLHFGGCFAKGLEITRKAYFDDNCSLEEAIMQGGVAIIKQWGDYQPPTYGSAGQKTLAGCLEIHTDYFREYHPEEDFLRPFHGRDGKSAVEFTFALPIPDLVHPQTGNPILYAGRFDMLAEHTRGEGIFVNDEKTAAQLGDSWSKSFQISSQMTGYTWAAKTYGYPVAGVSIRGVSIQKSGIKHLQVLEHRDEWMIERWLGQLKRDVARAIRMWEEDYWDMALDDACSSYGGCELLSICTSRDPTPWLKEDYEEDTWNPLEVD